MTDKLLHRRSLRLKEYDYAQAGAYFLILCTQNKEFLFGEVVNGKMRLSEAGRIAKKEWLTTAGHRQYVKLDQFVVMPNHFHGIIFIDKDEEGTARCAPTVRQFGGMPA